MIYYNLGRTQLAKRLDAAGIYKNAGGYYKREEIDRMLEGKTPDHAAVVKRLKGAVRI